MKPMPHAPAPVPPPDHGCNSTRAEIRGHENEAQSTCPADMLELAQMLIAHPSQFPDPAAALELLRRNAPDELQFVCHMLADGLSQQMQDGQDPPELQNPPAAPEPHRADRSPPRTARSPLTG